MRDRYPTQWLRDKPAKLGAGALLLALAGGVFGLEAGAAPSITSISPDRGTAFTRVTITGTGFGSSQGSSTVTFGGEEAARYYEWSDTEIEVRPASRLAAGEAHAVVVTVGGVASNAVNYTRIPELTAICLAPSQTIAEPSGSFQMGVVRSGPTTDAVTVTVTYSGTATHGADYTAPLTLTIAAGDDREEATMAVVDDSVDEGDERINYVVSAPGYISNNCQITLEDDNDSGSATSPSITNLAPTSGAVGTSVTITGTNFGSSRGTSTVTFNGTGVSTYTSWSDTRIVVEVPAGATSGDVVVTVGGEASTGVSFTVTATAPSITNLAPTSGAVGTSVTITGTNFGSSRGTSTVTFNGTGVSTYTSWSDTRIVVEVPAGATSGDVVVTVAGVASNGVPFTVGEDIRPLSLYCASSVSEPSGRASYVLAYVGSGNEPAADLTFTVTHSGTATHEDDYTVGTLTIRAGQTSGLMSPSLAVVDDSVYEGEETIELTASATGYEEAGCTIQLEDDETAPTPSITSLNPTAGTEGTEVTISGSNFGATEDTVTFNGTGVSTYTSWSDTRIVVEVPAGATSGDVVVTVAGVASNGVSFTVTASGPTITSLNPTAGTEGTEVTISGSNFGATEDTVTFNGTGVSTYTSWSDTQIVVEVPAGATSGDVVVTVAGQDSNGVSFTVTASGPTIPQPERVDPARLTEGTEVRDRGIYTVGAGRRQP